MTPDLDALAALLAAAYWEHRQSVGGWHTKPGSGKPCQNECFPDIAERVAADLEVMVADRVRDWQGSDPALIEAARREEAARTLMEEITEKAITRDGYGRPTECRICFAGIDTFHKHDKSCPIPRAIAALDWPIPEPEPPSTAATARLPGYFHAALAALDAKTEPE